MGSIPTIDDVRTHIFAEHDCLRQLLSRVKASAEEARRDASARQRVWASLSRLSTELEAHLAYEETMLAPLLTKTDAWGPDRAERLLNDHDGQRALLGALVEDARDVVRSIDALADEVTWFVDSFVRDMQDEEATFLNAEAMGDDLVVGHLSIVEP